MEGKREPQGDMDDFTYYYYVEKMRFPKKDQKNTIIFNEWITFKNIPLEAYAQECAGMVHGALRHNHGQGQWHPQHLNDWYGEHDDPRYIYNLVKRIVRVSVETNKIVAALPGYEG